MGIDISPNFNRTPVAYTKVSCDDCGVIKVVAHQEFGMYDYYCECGGMFCEPDFYPTEFQWEDAHWTYGHGLAVFAQMGIAIEREQYSGNINPEDVLLSSHKVTSDDDRQTMIRIAMLAIRLNVDISWG